MRQVVLRCFKGYLRVWFRVLGCRVLRFRVKQKSASGNAQVFLGLT